LDSAKKRPASIDAFTKVEAYNQPAKRSTEITWSDISTGLKVGIIGGWVYVVLFTLGTLVFFVEGWV